MKYLMTKRQKRIETHRAIKKILTNKFIPHVLNSLSDEVEGLKKDSEWLEEDNEGLKNFIIEKFSLNCTESKPE